MENSPTQDAHLGSGSDGGSSLGNLVDDDGGSSSRGRGGNVLSDLLLDGADLFRSSGLLGGLLGNLLLLLLLLLGGLVFRLLGGLVEEGTKLAAETTPELDLLGSDIGSGSVSLGSLVDLDVLGLLSSGGSSDLLNGGGRLFSGSRGGNSLLSSGNGSGGLLSNGLLLGGNGLLLFGSLLLDGTEDLAEERLALLLLGGGLLGGGLFSGRNSGSLVGLSLSDSLGSGGSSCLVSGSGSGSDSDSSLLYGSGRGLM